MSSITEKIKELRQRTQAGFMDCQKALKECGEDVEKAIIWLREKGIAKAAKKADAIAAEGLTNAIVKDDLGLVIEVNTQTDFVAKNENFTELFNEIAEAIFKNKKTSKEEVEEMKLPSGNDVKTACVELTAKIGEKIEFRRAELISKTKDQTFGAYQHSNGRISSIVLIDGKVSADVAKDVAMHLTAMNPRFLNKDSVDKNWLETEKKLLLEKSKEEAKSAKKDPKFAEKIVEGRLNKILAENCLEDQPFFKEPSLTIKKYLEQNKGKLVKMVRFELGEGIEKKVVDFASEVAAQMKK
ncbi:translation elongation factor Ts [Malacoplasma iowae]|uniref:Elongation factor Ts n=2 Tax=Malacoplasma iowae TaxID=2116 RepID=A0A084U4M8_MALIO|nr:translation elongation factor Ts [Malacoplasma iowae]VEU62118.1 Elongation factor Ts [Mycoplasmopsis fermentans]EGZ31633.1 elongation factor Ts [Malacoplasma iowae 695]KFB07914.1 translation elongation factor Ts [Malacoplasma iowae DK-CPA]QHG89959.1 translation elongation factor Ts [Malacoplasma iowae 695]WPL36312.1 translation elongation factor Ts [Malacoplasma iowae]